MMIKKFILIYFLLFSFIFSQNNNEFDIAVYTTEKISLEDKDYEDAFDDLIYTSLNKFIHL